jgi:hypothetical protein
MLYFRCPKNFTPGMKNKLLPIVGAVLLFASCKETAPPIDFGPKASDTSYMASPETAQQRMVVIEEFTGVTCPNCPAGHTVLKAIKDAHPGQIAAIGIQPFNVNQAKPCEGPEAITQHDNRTQVGTDVGNNVFGGISSIPMAGIDRSVFNGSLLVDRNNWTGTVNNRLAQPTAANVSITSTYNTATRQAVIKVRVAYTSAVSKSQSLTVALIENDVVDAQEGVQPTGWDQNYNHQHVLRDILTAPTGSAILTNVSTKQPGQVYERIFVYNVNAAWNPDECEIVAFVSNNQGADKEIVQGAEAHLK